MIRHEVRNFHGDLHPLLGSGKNEKRDALKKKFDILAEKRLLRGKVQDVFGTSGAKEDCFISDCLLTDCSYLLKLLL